MLKKLLKNSTIFYGVVAVGLIAASAFLLGLGILRLFPLLTLLQSMLFCLGVVHVWAMPRFLEWAQKRDMEQAVLFSALITLLGAVGFLLVAYMVIGASNGLLMGTAVIFFFVPFLVTLVTDFALAIPAKDYRKWVFPTGQFQLGRIVDPRIVVVNIDIHKSLQNTEHSRMKVRLPFEKPFGMMFHGFVEDYNKVKNPADPLLDIMNTEEQPLGWVFYVQSPWWKSTKVINPALTIEENDLKDDSVIIAKREAIKN